MIAGDDRVSVRAANRAIWVIAIYALVIGFVVGLAVGQRWL